MNYLSTSDFKEKVIELPYPPTVNHCYGQAKHGRRYLKKEVLNFRKEVAIILKKEKIKLIKGKVGLCVWLYPPDNRVRDEDNIHKCLRDALKGYAYEDDKFVYESYSMKLEPLCDGKGKVFIMVVPIPTIKYDYPSSSHTSCRNNIQ